MKENAKIASVQQPFVKVQCTWGSYSTNLMQAVFMVFEEVSAVTAKSAAGQTNQEGAGRW